MGADLDDGTQPVTLAVTYVLVGTGWLVLTEVSVDAFVEAPTLAAFLHLVSELLFVVVSGAVVYRFVRNSDTRLQETTAELRSTVQQTHVLHRILRHNLRNKGNVIVGHADRLVASEASDSATTIKRKAEELLDLSEQSRILREVSLGEHPTTTVDLVATVEAVLEEIGDRYPDAELVVELPETADVTAHPDIDHAIREVVINAIEHGEGKVGVVVETADGSDVTVAVTDDGPGFPKMERTVLEEGFVETQTHHSQGIGLWIVRSLLNASDGSLAIESGQDQQTTVRLTFQSTVEGALRRFLR